MISRERWERLRPLLEPALELTPEEASAYLEQSCADAPELRDEVERLFHACEQARGSLAFLDTPAAELLAPLLELETLSPGSASELEPGLAVGPYTVERLLGAGGMGVVYLAHDSRLDRKVALKLLPPWLAMAEAAKRRFVQEAKAASRLDHPNIETVYEIGETADGHVYIAMAYYGGETLQDRIARGPLELDAALDLAGQIAAGLATAHAHGIVHRDIKPSNVIVTPEGVAKIVDFGAAKVASEQLTVSGAALGTVAYMSPEQTRRDDVDGRTDIWALGVVLYEMLAGRGPFTAQNRDALIYAIRNDEPEPVHVHASVPADVGRIVHRCLEKEPRARYRDAAAQAKALRQTRELLSGTRSRSRPRRRQAFLGAAVLIAIFLAGAAVLFPRIRPEDASPGADSATPLPATTRLAVLPFADSSANTDDAYLADGLNEELITRLSQLEGLRVIARTSVMSFKGTRKSIAEIAGDLGVATLLSGSVRKSGERVHLSVRLVEAGSRDPLWAEEFESEIADLQAVQRAIIEEVVAALQLRTRARDSGQLARQGTGSTEAYTEYLKGRYFLGKLEGRAFEEARGRFERALDLDPTFARAWSGLAEAYNNLSELALLPASEAYPRAREAADRALELDPELAEAHAALAMALSMYYWDTEGADQHFRRALELDPNSALSHRLYAIHLRNLARFEDALGEIREAKELDPLSAFSHIEEGRVLYLARQYDAAIAKYEQLLRTAPGVSLTNFYLALAHAQIGRYDEALAALRDLDARRRPDAPAVRGYVYARMGRSDEARAMLAMLDELAKEGSFLSFQKAAIHVALGERDRALDLLERAAEERTWHMRLLRVEPIFDPLRSQPRFEALLKKVNLNG